MQTVASGLDVCLFARPAAKERLLLVFSGKPLQIAPLVRRERDARHPIEIVHRTDSFHIDADGRRASQCQYAQVAGMGEVELDPFYGGFPLRPVRKQERLGSDAGVLREDPAQLSAA